MKTRIGLFFAIILVISTSYFIFDFKEVSNEENRALKTSFEFTDKFFKGVLNSEFQDQLEEIMADQILFRTSQVNLQSDVNNIFGFHNRFVSDLFKYNEDTILKLDNYEDTDTITKLYSQEFYNFVEDITKQLADVGVDFSIYYSNLEQYYCEITFGDSCKQIGAEKINDNFYSANDILNNDEYAFLSGDHHLSIESQYEMFKKVMENLNLSNQVRDFDQYFDPENTIQVPGSREREAKYKFGITGTEYKPLYDSGMTMYLNGTSYEFDEIQEWNVDAVASTKSYTTPGYCAPSEFNQRIETTTGKFYVENKTAPVKQNILLIGDSQICSISPMFYKTFQQTHTFDVRYQFIDVVKYVEENDIDHVIYYGTNPFEALDVWFNKQV